LKCIGFHISSVLDSVYKGKKWLHALLLLLLSLLLLLLLLNGKNVTIF